MCFFIFQFVDEFLNDERTFFKSVRNFIDRFSFGKFFLNLSFQQFMLTIFKFSFS